MGQQTPDLDVSKKYVFVDEAGFNLHIQRNRGHSGNQQRELLQPEKVFHLLSWEQFHKTIL